MLTDGATFPTTPDDGMGFIYQAQTTQIEFNLVGTTRTARRSLIIELAKSIAFRIFPSNAAKIAHHE
jgi:hypothetical protein